MVFSSPVFLFFYLTVTLALYFVVPLKWRNLVLLVVSLLFYGWGERAYVLIMVLSIAIDYVHGILVEKYRADDKKARLVCGPVCDFQFTPAGIFQVLQFYRRKSLPDSRRGIAGSECPPAHRHFIFHLPDNELYH